MAIIDPLSDCGKLKHRFGVREQYGHLPIRYSGARLHRRSGSPTRAHSGPDAQTGQTSRLLLTRETHTSPANAADTSYETLSSPCVDAFSVRPRDCLHVGRSREAPELNPSTRQKLVSNYSLGRINGGKIRAVTDPRDGRRVALKKMPNVFQTLISSKRVFRELRMLCFFKHENVLSALDILQPPHIDFFQEIYVITELMQSDLHKIIVSPQHLSADHVKVFLYQILRGLKYLHSARIIHRDIKPGNLLVNSNCVLKICDFGLARVEEPDESKHMTQEVVTQYYRAPELLMGARHYTQAVDVWSVGCIFGELLGRRILFQAQSPVQQLERITDLLGTPNLEDMKYACEGAVTHMLRRPPKPPALPALYTLSSHATHEAVHLLTQMLSFDPDKRLRVTEALAHPYLDEGRLRYHSCMCTCCASTNCGSRQYTHDFEPKASHPFDDNWESDLRSMSAVKERLHKFIMSHLARDRVPLCINPMSAAYKSFASSTVAHPSELPPSPHLWDH
ncbi:unnamed protein product, partial [Meganyctiphanes norvegica]